MRRRCVQLFIGLVLWVAACPCALAAEDEPETGTIEVEVVYKDTGEPVPGLGTYVEFWEEGRVYCGSCCKVGAPSRTTEFKIDQEFGDYEVRLFWLGPYLWPPQPELGQPITHREPVLRQVVSLSDEQPVAHVRFEVERGWELVGTVRRQDGSPLPNALVMVEQDASGGEWSFSFTESNGTFKMLGVAPAETARVRIESVVDAPGGWPLGLAPLYVGEIELTGEETEADFEVEVGSLNLVVDYELPVWPFRQPGPGLDPAIAIWIDAERADGAQPAAVLLDSTAFAETLPRRGGLVFRADRSRCLIRDLPLRKTLALGIGVKDIMEQEHDNPAAGCTFHSYRTVTVDVPTQTVRLRVYAPGARASRVLWYGVGVLVMAVLLTILVRGARKRRRAES